MHRRRERGAVAVEFALVAPILVALTMGIIEVGLLVFGASSVQAGVSSAARLGASQSRVNGYQTQVADALSATLNKGASEPIQLTIFSADPATGLPVSGEAIPSCNTKCYRFTWNATTKKFDPVAGPSWAASAQRACGPASSTDFMGVWVKVRHSSLTGAIPAQQFTGSAIARLEPISMGTGATCM